MSDSLFIRDLKLDCLIGVYPEERRAPRPLVFNIELMADLQPGTRTDRVEDTLSYEGIYNAIRQLAEGSCFQLVEALAEAVATCCLTFPRVEAVTVRIDKPDVFPGVASCGVCMRRERRQRENAGIANAGVKGETVL
jgi:dihydroneopterin aldolase